MYKVQIVKKKRIRVAQQQNNKTHTKTPPIKTGPLLCDLASNTHRHTHRSPSADVGLYFITRNLNKVLFVPLCQGEKQKTINLF